MNIKDVSADDPRIALFYNTTHVFSRYFDARLHNAHRLPRDGAALMIGNHALMGVDSWALIPELYQNTRRVTRGLGLRSLFKIPLVKHLLEGVGFVAGRRSTAVELLERGELVLTYPGGAKDSLKPHNESHTVHWDGRVGFAHVAIRSNAPVIPIAGVGPDECFPRLLDGKIPLLGFGSRKLRAPLFLPIVRPVPFDFYVGEPLMPPVLPMDATPQERERAARDFAAQCADAMQSLLDAGCAQRRSLPSLSTSRLPMLSRR